VTHSTKKTTLDAFYNFIQNTLTGGNVNNMKPKTGLRQILLDYLKVHKILNRKVAHAIGIQNHYEPATVERVLRWMKHEVGVNPLNYKGEPANIEENEHIVSWGFKSLTVFKVWKKKSTTIKSKSEAFQLN